MVSTISVNILVSLLPFAVYPVIRGDPNEEYVVIENQTITLPCDAYGVPTPNITWRKNFVPFLPESDTYIFGDFGLTISDAQVYDQAIYECVASNVAGIETKVITLYVHGMYCMIYYSHALAKGGSMHLHDS